MAIIALTGDVMLGRLVNEHVRAYGPAYVWGDTAELLMKADLAMINLECAVTSHEEPWPEEKAFYFRADPEAITCLKLAGIDCVTLANNHTLDFREAGLLEMLELLDRAGIRHAGAGRNLEEAMAPAVMKACDMKIAVVAFQDNEPSWAAGERKPGTFYLPVTTGEKYFGMLRGALKRAKELADLVILSAHWGPNLRLRPSEEFRKFAHAAMDAGADIFHGHSAHTFQGIEIYKGKPILYDTGDFVDDYMVTPDVQNDQQLLYRLVLGRSGVEKIEMVPVLISQCQVNVAHSWVVDSIERKLRMLCSEMGTKVERLDDRFLVKV